MEGADAALQIVVPPLARVLLPSCNAALSSLDAALMHVAPTFKVAFTSECNAWLHVMCNGSAFLFVSPCAQVFPSIINPCISLFACCIHWSSLHDRVHACSWSSAWCGITGHSHTWALVGRVLRLVLARCMKTSLLCCTWLISWWPNWVVGSCEIYFIGRFGREWAHWDEISMHCMKMLMGVAFAYRPVDTLHWTMGILLLWDKMEPIL